MLHYLQQLFQALDFSSLWDAVLRVAAIFLCLTVHETCHGLAALALGDPTAKSMHRLSLNPLRHIDWIGLLLMFVAGFGWAKPVPVDPRYFKNPKRGMALTALAGPVSNLVLAFLALLVGKVIYLYTPDVSSWNQLLYFLMYTLAPLSIGLGVFNLIPIPPLDGSKVLGACCRPAVLGPAAVRAVRPGGAAGAVVSRHRRRRHQPGDHDDLQRLFALIFA